MINATRKSPPQMQSGVSRLVKQAGADTSLKNAARDGAEWAWIPHGDTCAFCITLASRGWQRQSLKAMMGGHAEHIHSNCDCEYAIRFSHSTNVAGVRPGEISPPVPCSRQRRQRHAAGPLCGKQRRHQRPEAGGVCGKKRLDRKQKICYNKAG